MMTSRAGEWKVFTALFLSIINLITQPGLAFWLVEEKNMFFSVRK